MILQSLIARAHATGVPSGYESSTVQWVLNIREDGTFLGVEDLRENPRRELIPKTGTRGNTPVPNTGIDSFMYTLGAGGAGREASWTLARHDAYRAQLARVHHPAARGIERFLANPDRPLILPVNAPLHPGDVPKIRAVPVIYDPLLAKQPIVVRGELTARLDVQGAYRCLIESARGAHTRPDNAAVIVLPAPDSARLLVEVEGYPNWWLDPAVMQTHTGVGPDDTDDPDEGAARVAGWKCSLCYQEKPIARLWPPSSWFKGGLVTFNSGAWCGFGHGKGAYNAPTCKDCASGVAAGLDSLAASGMSLRLQDDALFHLWWSEDPTAPPTWDALFRATDSRVTDEEREDALREIPDGPAHYVSLGKLQARLAPRRYTPVDGAEAKNRIRRWFKICRTSISNVASALTWRGLDVKKDDPARVAILEALLLLVITDEPVPPSLVLDVHALLIQSQFNESSNNRYRLAFLDFIRQKETLMPEPSPRAPNACRDPMPGEESLPDNLIEALNYGRAFGRADSLQWGRVQVTARDSLDTVSKYPDQGAAVIQRVSTYRKSGDFILDTFMGKAGALPMAYTANETAQFLRGFYYQIRAERDRIAAAVKRKQEAAAARAAASTTAAPTPHPAPES